MLTSAPVSLTAGTPWQLKSIPMSLGCSADDAIRDGSPEQIAYSVLDDKSALHDGICLDHPFTAPKAGFGSCSTALYGNPLSSLARVGAILAKQPRHKH